MKQMLIATTAILALLILTAFSTTKPTTESTEDYDYLKERLQNTTQYSVEVI